MCCWTFASYFEWLKRFHALKRGLRRCMQLNFPPGFVIVCSAIFTHFRRLYLSSTLPGCWLLYIVCVLDNRLLLFQMFHVCCLTITSAFLEFRNQDSLTMLTGPLQSMGSCNHATLLPTAAAAAVAATAPVQSPPAPIPSKGKLRTKIMGMDAYDYCDLIRSSSL